MREGLFNEDDLHQLENGYSVSDTDEEKGGLLSAEGEGELLSLRSGIDNQNDIRLFGVGQESNAPANN